MSGTVGGAKFKLMRQLREMTFPVGEMMDRAKNGERRLASFSEEMLIFFLQNWSPLFFLSEHFRAFLLVLWMAEDAQMESLEKPRLLPISFGEVQLFARKRLRK